MRPGRPFAQHHSCPCHSFHSIVFVVVVDRRGRVGERGRRERSRTIASDRERWVRDVARESRTTTRDDARGGGGVVVACVVAWVVACVARGVEATTETTGVKDITSIVEARRRGDWRWDTVLRVVWREKIDVAWARGLRQRRRSSRRTRARRVNERTGRRVGI